MALHLGGFPSGAGWLWLRLLGHLASLENLVPYGRLRIRPIQFQLRSGWPQTRDHPLIQVNLDQGIRDSILWWRTHSSLHKGIPLVSPLIEASSSQTQVLWVGVLTWTEGPPQEGGPRPWKSCTLMWWNWMRFGLVSKPSRILATTPMLPLCATMSLPLPIWEIRGALGDVPHGHRYLRMGHATDTQTSPWASQCVSRSSEPQRSDSENRMESESSRSTACIPSLGQSTCGSVCTQVQHQTSNLHVSDSRTGALEGRQSSPIVGRSVRLRVPTNGSDQTDSEQVNLAQSGADPHRPPFGRNRNGFRTSYDCP